MSRAIGVLALGAAVKLAFAGTLQTCSSSSPLSCSSDSTEASCCYESPGGLLLQTQFWDYSPSIGPSDSWGIHGLWCVRLLQYHITYLLILTTFTGLITAMAPTSQTATPRVTTPTSPP